MASRFDGRVDIGFVTFGNFANHLFGSWVNRFEGLARHGWAPLSVNKALGMFDRRWGD
jgi:hypothetical protein